MSVPIPDTMSAGEAAPSPSLSHLTAADFQNVYEPSEDTFLLMDALEKDAPSLKTSRPLICLEVGSGSGAVITFLASLLQIPTMYWSTDVNLHACKCSNSTMAQNGVKCSDSVAMDLVNSFLPRLNGQVDVLVFNPPYVVTPSEEVGGQGIEASWAGGKDGREVTDRLLPLVPQLLSQKGVLYLLLLAQNKPDEVCRILSSEGLQGEVILARTARNERLSVWKFHYS